MKPATLRARRSAGGLVATLTLDGPPGNVLGISTCDALLAELAALGDSDARLVVIEGAGAHFSYGASIEEHLPDHAPRMLRAMGGVVRTLASFPLPTLAALRGRCLGGGLEIALACGMAWAEEGAILAVPEIRLGVLAPAASVLLPQRLPRGICEEMLLAGRDLPADEALHWGLIERLLPPGGLEDEIDDFARSRLESLSPLALRAATRAARLDLTRDLDRRLSEVEALYEAELLSGAGGSEGIRAFLEKRAPRWESP